MVERRKPTLERHELRRRAPLPFLHNSRDGTARRVSSAVAQSEEMMLCLDNAHQTALISLSRTSSSRSPRLGEHRNPQISSRGCDPARVSRKARRGAGTLCNGAMHAVPGAGEVGSAGRAVASSRHSRSRHGVAEGRDTGVQRSGVQTCR